VQDFPGNSNRETRGERPPAETPKKIEKVVTGQVIRRKKPLGRRFTELLVGGPEREGGGVLGHVMNDVFVPALKDTLRDVVTQFIEGMLYNGERPSRTARPNRYNTSVTSHVSYDRYASSKPAGNPSARADRRRRDPLDLDEIVLEFKIEAEAVADQMFGIVRDYGSVSVADLMEMMDRTPAFTDQKYGWTDLTGMNIRRVRDGYLLVLPEVQDLK
jgi:hypothetical protein